MGFVIRTMHRLVFVILLSVAPYTIVLSGYFIFKGVSIIDVPILIIAFLGSWISWADWSSRTVPDVATTCLAVVGLVTAAGDHQVLLVNAFSAASITIVLWLLSDWYFKTYGFEGLGLGDVKLLGAIMLVVGPYQFSMVLFIASIGGISFVMLLRAATGRRVTQIPFAPFLTLSLLIEQLALSNLSSTLLV